MNPPKHQSWYLDSVCLFLENTAYHFSELWVQFSLLLTPNPGTVVFHGSWLRSSVLNSHCLKEETYPKKVVLRVLLFLKEVSCAVNGNPRRNCCFPRPSQVEMRLALV